MNEHDRGLRVLVLGIVVSLLSGCATCKTSYRRDLSGDPGLVEANTSYRKAISWLDKAECSYSPQDNERFYTTAESYLSDAMYKLKNLGRDNDANVSEYIEYCEKIKSDTDVKMGASNRAMQAR